MPMFDPLPLTSVCEATKGFLAEVLVKIPQRVEAKVCSEDGVSVLCAVEEVFAALLSRATTQELVWLSRPPKPGVHVLRLKAFAADNALLGEAVHEFEA
jgi:hypothetical protein